MKAIKRIALLLLIFAFLIPAGCGNKTDGETDPTGGITDTSAEGSATETLWTKVEPEQLRMISTPPDDLLLIMAGGNDVSFYKGFSGSNAIMFTVLSSKKLNDEITVTVDGIDTPYSSGSMLALDELKRKASYYTFLSYQDIDWVLLGELYEAAMAAGENSPEYELYNEYENLYFHEFVYMPDMKPELYKYEVYLIFSYSTYEKTGKDEFNCVTMTIDGTDYDVDIGRVSIEYTYEDAEDIVSNIFSFTEGISIRGESAPNAGMCPNSEGLNEIGRSYGRVEMTFSRNATITGFRTFGGDTEIVSVELDVKREDITVNQAWTGEPMYFPAMTTVIPIVKFKNKSLAGRQVYNGITYLVMDYDLDGEQYSVCFNAPMNYGSRDAIELYAQEVDKVDLFPYYDNYLLRFWGLK